jgi:hypothetical protein
MRGCGGYISYAVKCRLTREKCHTTSFYRILSVHGIETISIELKVIMGLRSFIQQALL